MPLKTIFLALLLIAHAFLAYWMTKNGLSIFSRRKNRTSLYKKAIYWKCSNSQLMGCAAQKNRIYYAAIKSQGNTPIYYFDTDTPGNINSFCSAVQSFKNNCKKLFLLQQTHNFEDELCRACNCTKPELFAMFGAQGAEQFKNKFIADSDCFGKLLNKNLKLENLWSRPLVGAVSHLQTHQANGKALKDNNCLTRFPKK